MKKELNIEFEPGFAEGLADCSHLRPGEQVCFSFLNCSGRRSCEYTPQLQKSLNRSSTLSI